MTLCILPIQGIPNSVKVVNLAGEPLKNHLVQTLYQQETIERVYNLYGPSEDTTYSTFSLISRASDHVNIGRPIANTQIYILDENHSPTPPGIPGELCIGGMGLARGYLNRPELTAEKFLEIEIFGKPQRIYKTGDLARWLPDGDLEYLGRLDHQVKLRGFRIELSEIEVILSQHDAVREAVVVLYHKDDNPNLIAYLILESDQQSGMTIDAGVLRSWLKARLPEYMVPAVFILLDKLPLTPNGKIDRKALPDPLKGSGAPETLQVQSHANFIKPQTALEKQISEVWQEVLNIERVGIHDNFFDLGGHSLLLIQVQSRLRALVGESLPVVKLFQYPTIQSLAAHITHNEPKETADVVIKAHDDSRDIAIIGMAGRFPGAQDIETFWNNLRNGLESIHIFSDEELQENGVDKTLFNNPDYVKAGGILEGAELFDASFFGYTPKEAEILDPQQRLFLEIAWAGMEHAGYDVEKIHVPVGVFAGAGISTYFINHLLPNQKLLETFGGYQLMLGDKDFIATRIAYKLNLKGPALTIHTACSTSLVAVHVACQSLLNNECEMALAGGVSVSFPQKQGYLYQEGMIASPDGHCRAFDATAKGTVIGAGGGVVVLKQLGRALTDGDTVHGVIKGSAVNNDGMDKVGFTAPSVDGQAAVITKAMGGLDYESISYIEAHGTGTELGDPIEISALTQAYRRRTQKTGYCALGSVKTNIGHLDTAAGVAGLIKTVLALKHREIPPSLHFHTPNPQIDFANSPFFVNTELQPWESPTPRRAGVSSFGIGGTNAHVVVEEAPKASVRHQASGVNNHWQIVCLSARTESALKQLSHNLADYVTIHPELNLADIAYTLNVGRKAFTHRGFLIGQDLSEAAIILRHQSPGGWHQGQTDDQEPQVVFMFPGQGALYMNMAFGLYEHEPIFRVVVDECAQLLKPHLGLNLCELLYPSINKPSAILEQTQWKQPALFVVEYALAKLCMAWGLEPAAMIGHDIGDYVAACLAGVFSLSDALQLVCVREKLMQPAFGEQLRNMSLNPPKQPYISSLTGTWITEAQATSADYWREHLLKPVRLSETLQTLLKEKDDTILVELGPGGAQQQEVTALNLLRPATSEQDDRAFLLNALGQLWLKNVKLDWPALYADAQRFRIPLPIYPFERQRYWIDPIPLTPESPTQPTQVVKLPLDEWFYLPAWKCTAPLPSQPNTRALNISNWLIFHHKEGMGLKLAEALEQQGGHVIKV
ncbi:MAG: beta-ketoacyl synthase N-terminal-like domain-containing protein, partial [Bacteroidota bacterium]